MSSPGSCFCVVSTSTKSPLLNPFSFRLFVLIINTVVESNSETLYWLNDNKHIVTIIAINAYKMISVL